MYQIAIVDDEAEVRLRVHSHVDKVCGKIKEQAEIVEFSSAESLLFNIAEGKGFDLYLLDIELGDMSGLELAGLLRKKYPESYVIFITYHSEYAIQGYTCKAYRYLLKDKLDEQLDEVLGEVLGEMERDSQGCYMIFSNTKCIKIPFRDILYIEKVDKYSVVHTVRGEDTMRKALTQVFQELPAGEFMFVERRYIVSIRHVIRYQNNEVFLQDGSVLPVSRPQSRNVRASICEYWRREI